MVGPNHPNHPSECCMPSHLIEGGLFLAKKMISKEFPTRCLPSVFHKTHAFLLPYRLSS